MWEMRAAVERLRSSQTFFHSHRLLAMLDFLLEAAVRGGLRGLAEHEIAAAFHRSAHRHEVVRVQTKRLRERLEEYYTGEGASDQVVVRMNAGDLTPVCERR